MLGKKIPSCLYLTNGEKETPLSSGGSACLPPNDGHSPVSSVCNVLFSIDMPLKHHLYPLGDLVS